MGRWITLGILLVVSTLAVIHLIHVPTNLPVSEAEAAAAPAVETGMVAPDDAGQLALQAPSLSTTQMEQLQLRKLQMREAAAQSSAASPLGLPLVAGRATDVATPEDAQFHGNPATLVIGRNNRNTNANNPAKGSTLAEPAA